MQRLELPNSERILWIRGDDWHARDYVMRPSHLTVAVSLTGGSAERNLPRLCNRSSTLCCKH